MPGHDGWLTRFKIDYAKHTFTVDAVWPNVGHADRRDLKKPVVLRAAGRTYLAGSSSGKESAIPKRTAKIVCPAVILAKRRTAKAKGRASWLMSSIGIIKGSNSGGVPGGIRIWRNLLPW